jgi:hypothetical protein
LNYNIGNVVAKRACQRDNVGKLSPAFADANMKIQSFVEDIKFKTYNLISAGVNIPCPDVTTPCYCKNTLGHSAAFDPPVSIYQQAVFCNSLDVPPVYTTSLINLSRISQIP